MVKRLSFFRFRERTAGLSSFRGRSSFASGLKKRRLSDYPEKERTLWRIFDQTPFEEGIAADDLTTGEVLGLIDYPAYFSKTRTTLPESPAAILEVLEDDRLVRLDDSGRWSILNLGAILFASNLPEFASLRRKSLRVIQYEGNNRVLTIREREGRKGYASEFEDLIGYINGLLPSNEVVEQAIRRAVPMFPELAVRELVANALVHQDFFVTGTGPTVEIFSDRMEITNPGDPIVDPERFLDSPPKSRNEDLAA